MRVPNTNFGPSKGFSWQLKLQLCTAHWDGHHHRWHLPACFSRPSPGISNIFSMYSDSPTDQRDEMSSTGHPALLPWKWHISPLDASSTTCPSVSAILGTFAAVNVINALLGVVFGHRLVVNKLSCGLLGKRESKSWAYTWAVTVALQLGANAVIAVIIKNTPGYNSTFRIGELVLFFAARPRLSWIPLSLLWLLPRDRKHSRGKDLPWASAACAQLLAEFCLLILGLVVMGRTAHFAASNGYYRLGQLHSSLPHWAHVMYAGALYYLVGGIGLGIMQFIALVFFFRMRRREIEGQDSQPDGTLVGPLFLILSLITFWLSSWLFWAGFVHVAGDL